MEVKLTYYGHVTFMLSNGETTIVFDPFFNGNTWEKAKPEDIKCQYIVISHGHGDHYGDADLIGKANNALVISTAEVAHTPAFHGAGIPGGHAAGVIVTFYGKTLYFAGDTAFFSDMQYLNRFGKLDYALLPIGDNFTMGPEDALLAASLIKADVTIPIHYKTWPVIDQDPDAFVAKLEAEHHQKGLVVEPGSTIVL